MAMENRISIEVPPADLKAALDHINAARTILESYLKALTPEDRKKYNKMGDKSEPFVGKVIEYLVSEPQFMPPYLPVAEMNKDWGAVKGLTPLERAANLLYLNLNDTILLAGSEVYDGALSYYNSVKYAARLNAPDAKGVYDDLAKKFEGQGKKTKEPTL